MLSSRSRHSSSPQTSMPDVPAPVPGWVTTGGLSSPRAQTAKVRNSSRVNRVPRRSAPVALTRTR